MWIYNPTKIQLVIFQLKTKENENEKLEKEVSESKECVSFQLLNFNVFVYVLSTTFTLQFTVGCIVLQLENLFVDFYN